MDQIGPLLAAELARVKAELKREKERTYKARQSRDLWRQRAVRLSRERRVPLKRAA